MAYEIGMRIRKYREDRGLSQKELAGLIGVSNSRVSNWELGINRPDVDILSAICTTLKVSPSELLNYGPKYNDAPAQSRGLTEDEYFIVRAYRTSERAKQALVSVAQLALDEKASGDVVVCADAPYIDIDNEALHRKLKAAADEHSAKQSYGKADQA